MIDPDFYLSVILVPTRGIYSPLQWRCIALILSRHASYYNAEIAGKTVKDIAWFGCSLTDVFQPSYRPHPQGLSQSHLQIRD